MRWKLCPVAALAVVACWCLPHAVARPPHKRAMADYYGPTLAKKLNDCRLCHVATPSPPTPLPQEGGGEDVQEKPHNAFGARIKAVRNELRTAGKKTGIAERLQAVADEDSDGDGVANLVEILTGHYPGEADDKPAAEELQKAAGLLAAFRKAKSAYPWTPFEVVKRPGVPQFKDSGWGRNPIDAFIAAEHEARGLKPRPEAPKHVLLRRIYLDLIGLPPTPEELHAFLQDASPDAYEKVVDRLLADPRYGERWGRHWMDVWRYSDWAGYGQEVRDSQPHVWRWRDWIIESLNQDKGYDRMILEMLAGDELAPEDANTVRATGYLVRNYKRYGREKWMQDVVDHTFQGFLGVTLGCAKCHNHMYDPILQKEYYQVRAVFEPHKVRIDRLPGQLDTTKDGLARAFDAEPDAKTFRFLRGDDRQPDKEHPLSPGVPEALGGLFPEITPVNLPPSAYAPEKRAFVVADLLKDREEKAKKTREALPAAQRAAAAETLGALHDEPLRAIAKLAAARRAQDRLALAELDASLNETKHWALVALLRAEKLEDAGKKDSEDWRIAATAALEAQRKAALLEARRNVRAAQLALRVNPKNQAEMKKLAEGEKALAKAEIDAQLPPSTAYTQRAAQTYPTTSTGRRLAFARWIADKENPLTARVAVNHIWLRHVGQPIVPSVFDFGRSGQPASHPALLDWLAAELMEPEHKPEIRNPETAAWSMKHLHRLIVASSTYRQASTPDSSMLAIDPDNRFYWRMSPRRLEAESVRDSILYVAGKLDRTMGGPDIDHQQGLTNARRSIYFRTAPEKQMEFLRIFDGPSVTECYRRNESVLPQQALALANSELTLRNARLLARSLSAKIGADATAFTRAAFEQVLSRSPTAEELAECVSFLREQAERFQKSQNASNGAGEDGRTPAADPALRARENLVHVLLNHHDFVTIR